MPRSDRDVLDAMADLLRATGRFDAVEVVTPDGLDQAVARDGVLALLTAGDAAMRREQAYRRRLRVVTYHVVLKARARDDCEGQEILGGLENEVVQALGGGGYTPYCLPERGGIDRGGFDPSGRPNYLTGMAGTFTYVVSPSQPLEVAP